MKNLGWATAFRTRASRDIGLALLVTMAASMVLVVFDINERFIAGAARFEQWQLDELPLVLLVAYAALAWFSARRWNEARQEIAARLEAERRISQLLVENQRLLRHAMDVQEDEKRNLARELHDELGQYLHAARTESAALRLVSGDVLVAERAAGIEHSLTHIQLMARDLIGRLRPPALDELGLSAALEQLVHRQCEPIPGLNFKFDIQRGIDHVHGPVAINAYRMVQECLTNALRHSGASMISLAAAMQQGRLQLDIADNGRGFPENLVAGFGLSGIRERVQALDGTLEIKSEPGRGVRVSVSLPAGAP